MNRIYRIRIESEFITSGINENSIITRTIYPNDILVCDSTGTVIKFANIKGEIWPAAVHAKNGYSLKPNRPNKWSKWVAISNCLKFGLIEDITEQYREQQINLIIE